MRPEYFEIEMKREMGMIQLPFGTKKGMKTILMKGARLRTQKFKLNLSVSRAERKWSVGGRAGYFAGGYVMSNVVQVMYYRITVPSPSLLFVFGPRSKMVLVTSSDPNSLNYYRCQVVILDTTDLNVDRTSSRLS
jgi:hypothetical protein